jgi:protein-L-isoaspartate O-methyltransferase
MQKSSAHNNIQVKCTMDEPIELLIDKLSTKSTDLYVFWVPYAPFSKIIIKCIANSIKKLTRITN